MYGICGWFGRDGVAIEREVILPRFERWISPAGGRRAIYVVDGHRSGDHER
jgi:hypothetical protein